MGLLDVAFSHSPVPPCYMCVRTGLCLKLLRCTVLVRTVVVYYSFYVVGCAVVLVDVNIRVYPADIVYTQAIPRTTSTAAVVSCSSFPFLFLAVSVYTRRPRPSVPVFFLPEGVFGVFACSRTGTRGSPIL